MTTKQLQKEPVLRFPQFSGKWKYQTLSRYLVEIKEKTTINNEYPVLTSSNNGLMLQSEYYGKNNRITERNNKGFNIIYDGYMTYRSRSDNRKFTFNRNKLGMTGAISTYYPIFTCKLCDSDFIVNLLNYKQNHVGKYSVGTSQTVLSFKELKNIYFYLPILNEQQMISSFLSSVNTRIKQLGKQKILFEYHKKGLMQKIFSQEIRFKDEHGNNYPDWKNTKLNKLMFEHKERNASGKFNKGDVLSVSGNFGVVNQIAHLGRSYAGESVLNYHIVRTGDIVYTKSPLKLNPYGIIKSNSGVDGIVSTLYAVYRCYKGASHLYLNQYFSLDDNVNKYLRPLVHKGAKNDMKINNARVLIDPIFIPTITEQQRIAKFLTTIDHKIKLISTELELAQTFKNGLLQQMFI